MGYHTEFEGELKFTSPLTSVGLARLSSFLGEDARAHADWGPQEFSYVDLRITNTFDGIKWNEETEKTYYMVEQVNFIIDKMREGTPSFGLEGEMLAQGEEIGDVWRLVMDNGRARRIEMTLPGEAITCPHCGEEFQV